MDRQDELLQILQLGDQQRLSQFMEDIYHINTAEMLEDLDDDQLQTLISLLSFEDMALLLEQCEPDQQSRIVRFLDTFSLVEVFSFMSTDDVADVLGEMSTKSRKEVLKYMKYSDRKNIQMILSYGEETAGGIMTTEFIALKERILAERAIQKIQEIAPDTEVMEQIFVTDEQHKLVGTVDLRDIFKAAQDETLGDIMLENPIFIHPEEDQEQASFLVTKYDLKVLPVVNRNNQILGIITVDDIIDVINEEHEEDVLAMGGVSRDEEVDGTILSSIRNRLPWLIVNLLTAVLASAVITHFESTIEQVIALSAAAPIIASMGGNAGTQTLSVVLTNLATHNIEREEIPRLFFKEILVGAINGAVAGIVAGVFMYLRYENIYLSVIMFASMVIALVVANIAGFVIPLVMKKMHFDPVLSSGIFLTTVTDVVGFFAFLALATAFLPHLLGA